MSLAGEVRVVDDVPAAFAALFAERSPRSVALSGGTTAAACYAALAAAGTDLSPVSVFFGDERFVPVEDPDSNEGMVRRVLLGRCPAGAVHSMATAGDTIDAAARNYDALVGAAPPIDLVHCGLGPDGHTCSLFPGSPALDEPDRLVVATGDDRHPHPRLTFTFPALARARLVVFTVAGSAKRDALARVRAGEDLPAGRVRAGEVVWLVDRAARGADERPRPTGSG